MSIKNIGKQILKARKRKKMTQTQLAKIISVSKSSISKWENEKQEPGLQNFFKLEKVLAISQPKTNTKPYPSSRSPTFSTKSHTDEPTTILPSDTQLQSL